MLVREITDVEGIKDLRYTKIGRPRALSSYDVRLIKEKYETGNYTLEELAEEFEVSETVIFKAKEGDYGIKH